MRLNLSQYNTTKLTNQSKKSIPAQDNLSSNTNNNEFYQQIMPPSHMPVNKTFAKNGLKPSDLKFINSSDLMTTPGAILQNKKT